MDQKKLMYFAEVCRTGSISKAAKNLNLTPQAVAKAVGLLEEELGFPLLSRNAEGSIATQAGEEVCRIAERVQYFEDHAYSQIHELRNQLPQRQTVTIGMLNNFLQVMPVQLFSDFITLHADYSMVVRTYEDDNAIVRALLAGSTDFAFCNDATDPSLFEVINVFHAKVYAIVSMNHPLAEQKEIDLCNLRRENVIADILKDGQTWAYEKELKANGIEPKIFLPYMNDATKRALVLSGNYVAFSMSPTGWLPPGIKRLDIRDLPIKRSAYLTRAQKRHLSRAA